MMPERKRTLFFVIFVGSAMLHAAVIAKFSVAPPLPVPPVESVLVLLSPAPQPEPDPSMEPIPEVPPAPMPAPAPSPQPIVDAAIPEETMPPLDLDEMMAPIRPAPPPREADESAITLPVTPTKTVPGDPTNETVVRAWLERHKRYPRVAVLRQLEGEALLYLRLAPDGSVLRVAIRTSSSYDLLDREVLRMVERSSPFPILPQTITNTEYLIPIEFRLE
jgi:protein TonB